MNKLASGLALLATMSACTEAHAQSSPPPNFTCELPAEDVRTVLSLDEVPAPIKLILAGGEGAQMNMADRDQDFNKSDILYANTPSLRFIQAGGAGNRWYVWSEYGGYTPGEALEIFALSADGRTAQIVYSNLHPSLCDDTAKHWNDPPVTAGG